MKRLAAVLIAVAFSAGVAVAGLGPRGGLERPLVLRGAASASPLLGIQYAPSGASLVRLDPKTLRIPPGRRLALVGSSVVAWGYSPDRRLLAFGNQDGGGLTFIPAQIRIAEARTLRRVRDVSFGFYGDVLSLHWVASDRLLAVIRSAQRGEDDAIVVTDRVAVIDPSTGSILAQRELQGRVIALARAKDALVLALEGQRWGPVQLVVASAEGTIRSVTLDRVEAGARETSDGVPRHDGAAVAVDRVGGRAYAVAAGCTVAEVDLGTLAVEYHTPTQPVSLLGRLHDWLEPEAQAKGPLAGSWRSAVWLGDGRLAVFGRDATAYQFGRGLAGRELPSGLTVIDARTWQEHLVDPLSSALVAARNALLSWGRSWDSGTQRESGTGLSVYDRTGLRRFQLFRGRVIYDVQVVGSRAFVRARDPSSRYAIVNLRTGTQVQTVSGREMPLVLSGDGGPFVG
jgi:hypothetical protein